MTKPEIARLTDEMKRFGAWGGKYLSRSVPDLQLDDLAPKVERSHFEIHLHQSTRKRLLSTDLVGKEFQSENLLVIKFTTQHGLYWS